MALLFEMAEGYPDTPLERAQMLESILISRATGELNVSDDLYQKLRSDLMADAQIKERLPSFVRTCRSLDAFWDFIKPLLKTYAERRSHIRTQFSPVLDLLEAANTSPADGDISDALGSFDSGAVRQLWQKALDRRQSDPEGAITAARTLLETMCKRILDFSNVAYKQDEELPKLYRLTAEALKLAPDQQTEAEFRKILGSCQNIVETIGTLRNKISDAHGRGGPPIKVDARHAALAVNLAGTMATFLVEAWRDLSSRKC